MIARAAVVSLGLGFLAPAALAAQTAIAPDSAFLPTLSALDPSVTAVSSGGAWAAGGEEGWYRVIIVTGGFEHVSSRLFVQWMTGPSSPDESARVVATRQIDLGMTWVLHGEDLQSVNQTWYLALTGTSNRASEIRRWRFLLRGAGGRRAGLAAMNYRRLR